MVYEAFLTNARGRLMWRLRLLGPLWMREDAGQAALEMALSLPVLLLVVTGITSIGLTLSNYSTLVEATNTGARQFAISRGQQNDPCALAVTAIDAAAPNLSPAKLTVAIQVFATATTSTTYTTTCSGATLNAAQPVIVTTSYPCSLQWYGAVFKSASTCKIQAQTTEVLQ